jgi:hypothetical protein
MAAFLVYFIEVIILTIGRHKSDFRHIQIYPFCTPITNWTPTSKIFAGAACCGACLLRLQHDYSLVIGPLA